MVRHDIIKEVKENRAFIVLVDEIKDLKKRKNVTGPEILL